MTIVVADTSVLINFLKIDRMDLIGRYPGGFVATDHVRDEVTDQYPSQVERYMAAVAAGHLREEAVTALSELRLFAQLSKTPRLGVGECSAIAVALSRGHSLAIDDGRAIKHALREAGLAGRPLRILKTVDVVVQLIHSRVLDISSADLIRHEWETRHRFRIPIESFRELVR
ncbi:MULTISPECIES: hypothetical protein [Rhizobium]|uniref:hypothetical protein n=1 Tax=Rhizobium TaxID=379 RepID=UPI0007E9E724|nr:MULTISPECIES: hypothetical protein [Rhizobium]ANK95504.1 hypothetical protein AMK01_PD00625 [Rhizobium sp. N6212]ANL01556.1 hypothetical protein AMK00_PD00623 [Rhizobium sp. N621]ANL07684.1 hypothetical protein AMJ99_PD00630 [Rhizobium esperanzae]ANL13854.1 hypothetical protein AMJ98_PE00630 [Rhizobium sp. N1341]ANL25839.1 hypothetical protein AMJ96_PD00639 [Rhizobium sp. N113]